MATSVEPGGLEVAPEPVPQTSGAGKRGGRTGRGRGGPIARTRTYGREVTSELRKVIYPSRSELLTYVTVVLVFVTVVVALVSGVDSLFTYLDLKVFG